jgi:SAM-dependent MidA family methyltransferase
MMENIQNSSLIQMLNMAGARLRLIISRSRLKLRLFSQIRIYMIDMKKILRQLQKTPLRQ